MTTREKILTFGVGGILVVAGLQYLWMQYRGAVEARQTRIATLDDQIFQARDQLIQGAFSDQMMGEYLVRSLPSDLETAVPDYMRWLYEIISLIDLRETSVKYVSSVPAGDLYQSHSFKVNGRTDQLGWVELLYAFDSKDYLHRISSLQVRPARDGGLAIDMTIDVISLSAAQPDLVPPKHSSPLIGDFDLYADTIWERNFFSPPNQPPRFTTPSRLSVNLGETAQIAIAAADPEEQRVRYEIVGDHPEGFEIDPRSGEIRWQPESLGVYSVAVRASDDGLPSQSSEQTFEIAVVEPPVAAEDPSAGFDEATQTVLTGLVQGRGDWTAWMKVRTQGTTLKLRPGDQFQIGKMSGTVVDVNSKYVLLESDGKRFELRVAGNLAEAARSAESR